MATSRSGATKDSFVVEMDRMKETKGAVMFGVEDDGRQPVTNVYFKKFGLEKIGEAQKVRVTIEKIS
jgi:hypothetical protein